MIHYIYTLKHPITNEVRYVGKTIRPKRRLAEHLYQHPKNHRGNWVKSLLKQGLKPTLEVIEECNDNNWEQREKFWITQFDNLTNSTDGGESCIVNEMVRRKLSILNSGKKNPNYGKKASKETLAKLSLVHKDKPLAKEHKDNIRKSMNKNPCYIDNVLYESIMEASRQLKIPSGTIHRRITSKNFTNYTY